MYFCPTRGTRTKGGGQNMCLEEETEGKKLCGRNRERAFIYASCMDVIQCISNSHYYGCSREIPFIKIVMKEMKVLFLSCVLNLSRSIFKIHRTRSLIL